MIFTDATSPHRNKRFPAPGGLVLLAALCLGGCARIPVPDLVFNDGPAPADPARIGDADPTRVLTGARPIRRADPQPDGSANLAAVPPRPEAFSTPIDRQAMLDRLQQDRTEGNVAGEALRATAADPQKPAIDIPTVPEAPPPVPEALPAGDR